MNDLETLVTKLKGAGCALSVSGGKLVIVNCVLHTEWLGEIRARKAALITALTQSAASPSLAKAPTGHSETDAKEAENLREYFEERAGILEYDAGLPRPEAELEAARMAITYALNRRYSWVSVRSALGDHPEILKKLPEKTALLDEHPLGISRLAVLPGKRVIRQGAYSVGL